MPDDDWKGEHLLRVPRSPYTATADSPNAGKKKGGRAAATEARRRKVKDLHAQGKTETDMAATLGCSRTCVRNDLKALGLMK